MHRVVHLQLMCNVLWMMFAFASIFIRFFTWEFINYFISKLPLSILVLPFQF
jgi:hypothetical protein